MEYTKIEKLKEVIDEIDTYRANTGYTSVYLFNGNVLYLKEDFLQVTQYLENL